MHRRFVVPLFVVAAVTVAATSLPAIAAGPPPRLAGPWYTTKELKALDRYAQASFSERQRILGDQASSGFDWRDASAGAVAAVGALLILTAVISRPALRHQISRGSQGRRTL